LGFDGESLEIGPAEQNAGIGWRRRKTQVNVYTRVESDPGDRDGRRKRVLVGQIIPQGTYLKHLFNQLMELVYIFYYQ
jgi:hypothetical protein